MSLPCLCRVFACCLPCLCRVLCRVLSVFAVSLPCFCCNSAVLASCLYRAFPVIVPLICSREAAALLQYVACGSALRWVANCSNRACVRVCLGCAVRRPCSRNALAVRVPTNPARSASRLRHVLPWTGLSRSISSGQALRANPRDAAKPCPEAMPCDVARVASPNSPANGSAVWSGKIARRLPAAVLEHRAEPRWLRPKIQASASVRTACAVKSAEPGVAVHVAPSLQQVAPLGQIWAETPPWVLDRLSMQ